MTVIEYNKAYNTIKDGKHTYIIYPSINTNIYPKGFEFEAINEIDLSHQWIKYCISNNLGTNRNIGKILLVE